MRLVSKGALASAAFVLALDVELEGDRPRLADEHLQSQLKQFAKYWPHSVGEIIRQQLAKRVVIVGGREARYPDRVVSRPQVLKGIVERHNPRLGGQIDCVDSEAHTLGNARAIAEWMHRNPYDHDVAFIACADWQVKRAQLMIRGQGIDLPVISLDAIFLAGAKDPDGRRRRREYLHTEYGGGAFAWRSIMEANGIADILCTAYEPLSEQGQHATSAAA